MLDKKKNNSKENALWLDDVISLFNVIGDNLFLRMSNVITWEKTTINYWGNPILNSISKTLETIKFALNNQSISDAYVLVRKVRDDALIAIMLVDLIEKYNLASFSGEDPSFPQKTLTKEEVVKWFKSNLSSDRKRKPSYNEFIQYFSSNTVIQTFINRFYQDKQKRWNRILNNHVHGNSVDVYFDNFSYLNDTKRLEEVKEVVYGLTSFILSIIILIDSTLLMSSDYMDALELGIEPPLGSQYWIAPIFSNFMKERFRKEEIEYLRKNQEFQMEF